MERFDGDGGVGGGSGGHGGWLLLLLLRMAEEEVVCGEESGERESERENLFQLSRGLKGNARNFKNFRSNFGSGRGKNLLCGPKLDLKLSPSLSCELRTGAGRRAPSRKPPDHLTSQAHSRQIPATQRRTSLTAPPSSPPRNGLTRSTSSVTRSPVRPISNQRNWGIGES